MRTSSLVFAGNARSNALYNAEATCSRVFLTRADVEAISAEAVWYCMQNVDRRTKFAYDSSELSFRASTSLKESTGHTFAFQP